MNQAKPALMTGGEALRDWAKLHADISKSRSFAAACNEDPKAGLLFLMMLPRADVLGIVDAHPVIFRGEVCPLLNLTDDELERCLAILQEQDMVVLYTCTKGDRWLWVKHWAKYQEVRWTHVGVTTRPLPEGWEPSDGLTDFLQEYPDKPLSIAVVKLRENYCSTTVALQRPRERAQETETEVERETDVDTEQEPASDDGAVPEEADSETSDSQQQAAIRSAFEALTGEGLPKALPGYSGAMKLVSEYGLPMVREWTVWLGGQELGVPEGANAWAHFKTTFRRAMNRDFEWRRKLAAPSPERQSWEGWPARLREPDLRFKPTAEELEAMIRSPDFDRFPLDRFLSAQTADRIRDARSALAE